jgi:hypothetical protein
MRMNMLMGVASLLAFAMPASGAQYLETIPSDVFQAAGDHAALARRSALCLAQASGVPGQTLQADAEAGVVVGPALFSYSTIGIPWSVKSIVTIETKDGRFRITHSSLAQKQGGPAVRQWTIMGSGTDQRGEGGWGPVGTWRFSGGEKVEKAAQALSQRIADCIQAVPRRDDW